MEKLAKVGDCYRSADKVYYFRKREHDVFFINVMSCLITLHSHHTNMKTEPCSIEEFSGVLSDVLHKLGVYSDEYDKTE